MDENEEGTDDSLIDTDDATSSKNESDTISKEIQKDIADYNDNLFWNTRY